MNNIAICLYKKNGFIIIGEKEKDSWLMQLNLFELSEGKNINSFT